MWWISLFFFFSSRRRHTRFDCDWSSDVCSSDLVNIGAGTITCNHDGVAKHETRIGDHAFVGTNSSLVAPLTIGEGAYIGAGSTIKIGRASCRGRGEISVGAVSLKKKKKAHHDGE